MSASSVGMEGFTSLSQGSGLLLIKQGFGFRVQGLGFRV